MFDGTQVTGTENDQFDGNSTADEAAHEPGEFPVDALSPVMRDLVAEVSRVYQVPSAMPAMAALAVNGAAVGKRYKAVGAVSGQQSFANLYVVCAAAKGGGKGTVANVIMKPLFEANQELLKRFEPEKIRRESEAAALTAQVQHLSRRIAKCPPDEAELMSLLQQKKARLAVLQPDGLPIRTPSLIEGNTTSEALVVSLSCGDGALLSFSPEAGEVVRVVLGKYVKARQGDADVLLSGWSSEPISYNRIGRGRVQLEPTIAALWFVQPFILQELLANQEAFERGLTARFLIFDAKIQLQHDDGEDRMIDREISEAWREYICFLAGERPSLVSSEVQCSPEARECFRDFHNRSIDLRLGSCADVEGELSRSRENAVRVSVGLWLADNIGGQITGAQAERAVRIVSWCRSSYLSLLRQERLDRQFLRAEKIRMHLLNTSSREMTLRDLETRHGIKQEEARQLANRFPDMLQIKKTLPGPRGGRPSEMITIPPSAV